MSDSVEKRIVELERRWTTFWKSLAVGAIGLLLAAGAGGVWVAQAGSETKQARVVADAGLVKSASNEKRIEKVEEVLEDHANHLEDLLDGQQAIADAVGAKMPKRKVRVKGVTN